MLTYFRGRYGRYGPPDGQGYTPNEYFTHQLDAEHILLTTRHRAWVILNPAEYELFLRRRLDDDPALYELLEDLGVILTPRNTQDIAVAHCRRYAFLHRPPSLFIMVVTNRCNMACVYCHAQAQPVAQKDWDMSEEVLRRTVEFFFSVPTGGRRDLHIEFQGGEPLLRYDLVQQAMDYASQLGESAGLKTHFSIVTNLTLMTDAIASDIQRRRNVSLCSSLDGPASVHDRQRCFPNGAPTHEQVIRWAKRLNTEYGIKVPFLPTFTRHALGHERELIDEYQTQGMHSLYLRFVNRTGRAHDSGYDIGLSAAEYVLAWRHTLDYVLNRNRVGYPMREEKTAHFLRNMLIPAADYMCLRRPCGCGVSQITVGHDGAIHGCDGGRSVPMLTLGNVLTDTYDAVYASPTVMALRSLAGETLPQCQTCAFSPYCGYCVARGINQHGTPVPQTALDFECQIYQEMLPDVFRKLLVKQNAAILVGWV